jgi:maleate cis-trans isomerase
MILDLLSLQSNIPKITTKILSRRRSPVSRAEDLDCLRVTGHLVEVFLDPRRREWRAGRNDLGANGGHVEHGAAQGDRPVRQQRPVRTCPAIGHAYAARIDDQAAMRQPRSAPAEVAGEATIEAVAPFVSERPDIVVHGCTAGGFLAGPEGNARIVAELERVTGAPVISTADAMVEALRHSGVRSTAVVTPYLPSVNQGLTRYVEAGGVKVETLDSFLCETTDALGAVTEPQVWEKALATVTPQSRALFIACSQLPTLDIIVPLRERLGIPVWSSIRATAWAMARMLAAKGLHLSLLSQEASAPAARAPAMQA